MAVPVYTTDLVDINLAEATGTWVEPTFTGETLGAGPSADTDFFIQGGVACISKAFNAVGVGGMIFNFASDLNSSIVSPASVYSWIFMGPSNAIDTLANGGYRIIIGSGTAAYNQWDVLGKDTYAYGGWRCVVVDPSVTVSRTSGSPGTVKQWFGSLVKTLAAIGKGVPMGNDAIRYGRTIQAVSGESGNFATFPGMAAVNDTAANRWGQMQAIDGGYQLQGLCLLGTAGTAVDFRDSNTAVLIAKCIHVVSTFNMFEIRNAGSRVDWTSISFLALGTVSRGNFTVTNDADVNWLGCTFTDVGLFALLPGTTATSCVFRRTDKITLAGATLTNCTIDSNRATTAVLAATPAGAELVTGCAFTSDGTGHGLEITGTAANMALTNNSWSGYASSDGSSGNEAVFVNIGSGNMDLTITGGTTPSVRTAGANVTVISGAVSATITVTTTDAVPVPIEDARVLVVAADLGPFPFDDTVTIARSDAITAVVTHTGHAMKTTDKIQITGAAELAYNGVFTITKIDNDSYSYTVSGTPATPATGTIKATFVVLSGLTNASGVITMSRVFPSAQPISGRVRKSDADPFYKTGGVSGSVSSTLGFSATVQMILDQ